MITMTASKAATVRSALIALGTLALAASASAQPRAPAYTGPQAILYIGENSCSGGYCGYSVWASFDSAITQAMTASGYVQAVRKADNANLVMKAGITDVSGGGGLCLPIIGCVNAKTVRANLEIDDASSGAVIWRDTCEGTSTGYSSWYWWNSVSYDSDDGKAAADCAGKLVQKFNASDALKPYLTHAPGSALTSQTSSTKATPSPSPVPSATAGSVSAEQAVNVVKLLTGALQAVSLGDLNSLFSGDPLNPVSLKAMSAAATADTLSAAAKLKFSVTPGDDAGMYRLVGLSYTLPDGSDHFVQLAVVAEGALNTRTGPRILYLSAFNPGRSALPALEGVSKSVETLLADYRKALNLP